MSQYQIYFAYGSNTDPVQMARRCPGAIMLQNANLCGYRLRFAGCSRMWDGGGVADVQPRRCHGHFVPGVLWAVTVQELLTLDGYEGHPVSYQRQQIHVHLQASGKVIHAWVYAKANRVPDAAPSPDYVATIRRGYKATGLNIELLEQAVASAPKAPKKTLVFVYGSLLSGLCNHWHLEGSEYRGATEVKRLSMVSMGGFPACTPTPQGGLVTGEVWRISAETLSQLDALEGHPRFYRRRLMKTCEGLTVWVYLIDETPEHHRGKVLDGCWRSHQERRQRAQGNARALRYQRAW